MSDKILVVEDSKPIAKVISQIAQALGYDVTIAATLAEVETILQQQKDFFVATVDYALPDAPDGEAIACILSHGVPCVVLTGKMDEDTRQRILSQPVIDYIPKENSQAFLYLKRILAWQKTNESVGILVVDDSVAARNHIVELLKRRNFQVYTAPNGIKALEVLEQHSEIKLVVTDLEMPEMNGITLTNECRKRYSREQLSIIGISGAENGVHSARFIKNGADDFLLKPFCPEEFYCRITQNIEHLQNIEKIQQAAKHDTLTELINRQEFLQQATQRINQYQQKNIPFCLSVMNLDYFKRINEQWGYDGGDHILRAMALFLRKHFGSSLIGRLGGDEFAVLHPGRDNEILYGKLDDFRRDVAIASIPFADDHISVSFSIGAVFNSQEPLANQLHLASISLQHAKENGRNQLVVNGEDD
jgi:diguanylate cyclase (GGDEF)-like protein